MRANPSRLLILGLLAGGPMHGHQIKRAAEAGNLEEWAEVRVGALYGMIHRLADEGLIRELRSEQEGRRPVRTVYEITDEGRLELHLLRERALREPDMRPAAVDLAVAFTPHDDASELRELLGARRARIATQLDELTAHRKRDEAAGLPPSAVAVFRHWELRLDAELRWHDELAESLPEIAAQVVELDDRRSA